MLRRLIMIKFEYIVPEEKRIESYDKILLEEREGILNLMIAGLQRYLQEGKLKIPDSVKRDTSEWIWEMDNLQEFIDRYVEFTYREEDRIEFSLVYEAYIHFCSLKNIRDGMLTKQEFSKRVKDKGFITKTDYVKREEEGKVKSVKITYLSRAKWKEGEELKDSNAQTIKPKISNHWVIVDYEDRRGVTKVYQCIYCNTKYRELKDMMIHVKVLHGVEI